MTARQFRLQIQKLGWSQSEAAKELGVRAGKPRINEWMHGKREIPPYIAAHMQTLSRFHPLLEVKKRGKAKARSTPA